MLEEKYFIKLLPEKEGNKMRTPSLAVTIWIGEKWRVWKDGKGRDGRVLDTTRHQTLALTKSEIQE